MAKKLDLVGVTEVREILGVSRQRVHQIIQDHPDFPEAVAEPASGRIWLRKDIEVWARRTGRARRSG
jgi:predicted DNA-binding transcriptional regulator AlpA